MVNKERYSYKEVLVDLWEAVNLRHPNNVSNQRLIVHDYDFDTPVTTSALATN
jgi:hypothetical protein